MNSAQLKLAVGGVLLAGGIGYMAYLAASQTGQYAIGVSDYTHTPDKWAGRGLRIAGLSEKGSWSHEGSHHTFRMLDDKDVASNATTPALIDVVYDGTMPDTFAEERQVIVAGKMNADGKTLNASEVIPQCASKYKPADGFAKDFEKHHGDGSHMPDMHTAPAATPKTEAEAPAKDPARVAAGDSTSSSVR